MGKEHFINFIQASCCSQLRVLLPASVYPRVAPFLMNQPRMKYCSFSQFPAYLHPHTSLALTHVSLPLGRGEKERRLSW